jgi:hypothetical protein
MQYDSRRLGLPDLEVIRRAALYVPAGAARELGRAVAELEAAREAIWHLLTLLGERGVAEYGLPPWAEDPSIRGLLIPEAAFLALDGLLGAYRRSYLAEPKMPATPHPVERMEPVVRFTMPLEPCVVPLPRAPVAAPCGGETRTEPLTAAAAGK